MSGHATGIRSDSVTEWYLINVPGTVAPLRFDPIAGGRSNLTYVVTDVAGRRTVLRRPPMGHLLPSAHDMGREHRIIASLGRVGVPVPQALGLCTDETVNERPFYVMDFVDGTVLRDFDAGLSYPASLRAVASRSIADTLADLHAVDVDDAGLGDLGKREDYIARQLKRWHGQFHAGTIRTDGVPALIDAVHARLSAMTPPQRGVSIVHGDYRLDNTMLGPDGTVAAILDWELCTLGDPLADLGMLMTYWSESFDSFRPLGPSATEVTGFATRADLVDAYARRSGRDVSDLRYYQAFGHWKLACILDGVSSRYQAGAMGDDGADWQSFDSAVESLAANADALLGDATM
jgi:aminoglycoside phosphotransferase (APT) family kinase protein